MNSLKRFRGHLDAKIRLVVRGTDGCIAGSINRRFVGVIVINLGFKIRSFWWWTVLGFSWSGCCRCGDRSICRRFVVAVIVVVTYLGFEFLWRGSVLRTSRSDRGGWSMGFDARVSVPIFVVRPRSFKLDRRSGGAGWCCGRAAGLMFVSQLGDISLVLRA